MDELTWRAPLERVAVVVSSKQEIIRTTHSRVAAATDVGVQTCCDITTTESDPISTNGKLSNSQSLSNMSLFTIILI